MVKQFWSRALMAVAVTGGAFMLGRALSHSATAGAAIDVAVAADEDSAERYPSACGETCRHRGLQPDAPALPAPAFVPQPEVVLRSGETVRPTTAPREGEIIAIPSSLEPAPQEATDGAALIGVPNRDVSDGTKGSPTFMPYVDDGRSDAIVNRSLFEYVRDFVKSELAAKSATAVAKDGPEAK